MWMNVTVWSQSTRIIKKNEPNMPSYLFQIWSIIGNTKKQWFILGWEHKTHTVTSMMAFHFSVETQGQVKCIDWLTECFIFLGIHSETK